MRRSIRYSIIIAETVRMSPESFLGVKGPVLVIPQINRGTNVLGIHGTGGSGCILIDSSG